MQFSDTSNKNGILQMCEKTTGLGDAKITGVATELAYFTNLVNQWLQIGHFYAWTTDKNWDFDDSNYTNFPFATTTIIDDQVDYTLPSDLMSIRSVECLDKAGNYFTLHEMSNDSSVFQTSREQETAGIPTHYRKVGLSLKLYPKPDAAMVTASAGLRIRYGRDMDLFATTDTTQEPGFSKQLHPICYYGPCWEWAMVNNIGNIAQMCERMLGQWPGIREIAERHFSSRDKNDVSKINRLSRTYI
jgi:hypothetical protein